MENKSKLLFIALSAITFGLLLAVGAMALTPPSTNPPTGAGILSIYNGSIGINYATSSYPLTISSSTDSLFGLIRSGAANPVIFKVGADSALVINASSTDILTLKSGNVGIGTTTPAYKLDVVGDVRAVSFLYSSDISLKNNIEVIPGALDKVLQLKGIQFNWKENNRQDIGFIAQDVEKVFPELVHTSGVSGLKSVEYGNLAAPLVEAIKEQQKQIEALKAEIEKIKN